MVEDVVGSVSSEWNQSEDAPREFVSTVSIVGFKDSDKSPLENCEKVKFWAENEHAEHGGVMISKDKLERVRIFTGDADWVHELMMLFVDQLVEREIFILAV